MRRSACGRFHIEHTALSIRSQPSHLLTESRMAAADSLTIVVPTRDDADSCTELLHALMAENRQQAVPVRVLFLANDTVEHHTASLQITVSDPYFSPLRPHLLRAQEFPNL